MPACTCIRIIKWILILETHDSHKVPCSHQKTPQTNQPSHVGIIKLQLHLHANIERTQLEVSTGCHSLTPHNPCLKYPCGTLALPEQDKPACGSF